MLLFNACVQPTPEKSAEMQALLYKVNSIRNPAMANVVKSMMDSGYAVLPKPAAIDPFFYYEFYNWYHRQQGENELALHFADSMLLTIEGLPHVEDLLAHGLVTKGIALKALNQYPEALQAFYAANVYAEEYTDSCASAEIYISLGFMLYEQKNYRDAIGYLSKAYQGTQTCAPTDFQHYFVRQQMCLNALGLCYEKLGKNDSALLHYQKTLDFIDDQFSSKFPNAEFLEVAKGVVYGKMGTVEIHLGKLDQAETHLKKSIAINNRRSREHTDAVLSQIKLAKLYLAQQRFSSCDSLIQRIAEYTKSNDLTEANLRLARLQRDYFSAIGDYHAAFNAFHRYQNIADSINQVTRELSHMDVEKALVELSRKDELDTLHERAERKNLYIGAALLLLLALVIILALIRRNLLASKANIRELNNLNQEVTEQNANLSLAMENLESGHEEMERVLGIVAHDLRSPIGSIVSLTEVLDFDESIKAESKEHISMIRNLGKDSINLMEGLLNMQLVNGDFVPESVDLYNLISYCAGVMEFSAKEKGQKIKVEGESTIISGSRDMLWRVVINLLSNAIKFSNAGGTIHLKVVQRSGQAHISLRDEGIGIPESLQDQVFDMLTKAKRKGTEGEKTHGLGLSICKRIMELHGGRIWFESVEGKGTTFYLEFA